MFFLNKLIINILKIIKTLIKLIDIHNMDLFNFPIARRVSANLIADDLIGLRHDETWEQAVHRHMLEMRLKKITKIKQKLNDK